MGKRPDKEEILKSSTRNSRESTSLSNARRKIEEAFEPDERNLIEALGALVIPPILIGVMCRHFFIG